MAYQNLFNLLSEQYNLNLLESELQEIIRAVHKDENKAKEEELCNKWIEETDMRLMFTNPYKKASDKLSVSKEDLEQNLIEHNIQIKILKDNFASQAMQSLILKGDTSIEFICKKAYQYAEEMIKQRNNINK
jgi:hypothetical protein